MTPQRALATPRGCSGFQEKANKTRPALTGCASETVSLTDAQRNPRQC